MLNHWRDQYWSLPECRSCRWNSSLKFNIRSSAVTARHRILCINSCVWDCLAECDVAIRYRQQDTAGEVRAGLILFLGLNVGQPIIIGEALCHYLPGEKKKKKHIWAIRGAGTRTNQPETLTVKVWGTTKNNVCVLIYSLIYIYIFPLREPLIKLLCDLVQSF